MDDLTPAERERVEAALGRLKEDPDWLAGIAKAHAELEAGGGVLYKVTKRGLRRVPKPKGPK